MPHEFEIREEIELEATPEQVWEAIASGPGIDSWFMGHSEVEPRLGGKVSFALQGFTSESSVTAYEPLRRFAYRSQPNPDGTFMAFEYLLERRDGGVTVLRFVHSGMLGDDWEAEYDGLKVGDRMYLEQLAQYVRHFAGRTARFNLFLSGPQVADQERVWAAFARAFGLTGEVHEGAAVRLAVAGIPPAGGVVSCVRAPRFLGVRTSDGLYLLVHGYGDGVVVEYHCFSDALDQQATERAWQSWLAQEFGA